MLLTNFREDSSSFRNQVSLSPPLRFTDDTDLVAAVLQAQPAPLEVERAARQADEIIATLVSCSVPRPTSAEPAVGFDKELIRAGWQWLSDVETTWRKALRMPLLRNLFLNFALQENNVQARLVVLLHVYVLCSSHDTAHIVFVPLPCERCAHALCLHASRWPRKRAARRSNLRRRYITCI